MKRLRVEISDPPIVERVLGAYRWALCFLGLGLAVLVVAGLIWTALQPPEVHDHRPFPEAARPKR